MYWLYAANYLFGPFESLAQLELQLERFNEDNRKFARIIRGEEIPIVEDAK